MILFFGFSREIGVSLAETCSFGRSFFATGMSGEVTCVIQLDLEWAWTVFLTLLCLGLDCDSASRTGIKFMDLCIGL